MVGLLVADHLRYLKRRETPISDLGLLRNKQLTSHCNLCDVLLHA